MSTFDLSSFEQEFSVQVQIRDAIGKLFVSQQVQLDNGLEKNKLTGASFASGIILCNGTGQ